MSRLVIIQQSDVGNCFIIMQTNTIIMTMTMHGAVVDLAWTHPTVLSRGCHGDALVHVCSSGTRHLCLHAQNDY